MKPGGCALFERLHRLHESVAHVNEKGQFTPISKNNGHTVRGTIGA